MRYVTRLLPSAALLLLIVGGCERKIVNEVIVELPPGNSAACFTCHTDSGETGQAILGARQGHDVSKHGTGDTWNRNRYHPSVYSSCERCHTNEGFVAYVTGEPYDGESFSRITCFTCHAPHTEGTLEQRVQTPVTLEDGTVFDKGSGNTCATCHHSRRDVNTYVFANDTLSNHYGPHHSNQADMLLGTNAYEYSAYGDYGQSSHRSATDGCIQCHLVPRLYATGSHAWYLEDEENEYENVYGCNDGCHDGNVKDFDFDGAREEIDTMLDSLATLLFNAGLLEWVVEGTDSLLEPTEDRAVMTADSLGAVFNYMFVYEDRSHGLHNPDYAEDLLQSSIDFMNDDLAPRKPSLDLIAAH